VKRVPFAFPVAASLALMPGCAKKDDLVDKDWVHKTDSEQQPWREVESLFTVKRDEAPKDNVALRGVRHDLSLSLRAAPTARCTCLDVAAGAATDPRFRWVADVPPLAPDQIAFAARTDGSTCGAPTDRVRRPSIYAVDQVNGDTIIVIEELPSDRPQALGAIVPMPANGGSIYVRARSDKGHVAMYAQGPKGPASMCRVMTRGSAPAARNE